MPEIIGYNLALEFLNAQQKAFDFTENKIGDLITTLSTLNDENRDLQKMISSLTHAKKDKKDADFTQDQEMKDTIQRLHVLNPQIFGATGDTLTDQDYIFKVDDIETTLNLLDSTVKAQVSKINETTMYINQSYEDRIHYTENAQKTLDMLNRHIDSILSKMRA